MRHDHEAGQVTLGGHRVGVERPRVRATDGSAEVAMSTYAHLADRDPLTKVVLEQMLAGVSTRRFARTREPVGSEVASAERSTSRSAVSREFVGRTGEHLRALMARSPAESGPRPAAAARPSSGSSTSSAKNAATDHSGVE